MDEGYVKLWRKSLKNGWLKNHKLWVFWSYCLMRANHTRCKVIIGYQEIVLEPGQFIFGRKKAAKELKMSESAIQRNTYFLEKAGNLNIKRTNKYSIFQIVNWHLYQDVNIKRTSSEHQANTDKNDKNEKNTKRVPFEEIKDLYHQILPDLPKVKKLTSHRKTQIKARWFDKETTQHLKWWKEYFEYVHDCEFLMGSNGRQWQADLEWLTKEENFVKVIEGKYLKK